MIGIYKITNTVNGKIYVGQSIDIARRWEDHINKKGQNSLISQAIKKYGFKAFTFEVLEECTQNELDDLEQYWIDFYDSCNNGYNLTLGGQGSPKYKVADILASFEKTQNITQTARECGCSLNVARRIIHGEGINFHEQSDAKPIEAINPETLQTIKQFTSIRDAASSLNVSPAAISAALKGTHKTACGYYWKEIDNQVEFAPITPKMWKTAVCQINAETGEIIATYESASAAAEALGKDRKNGGSQITAVCRKRKKSTMGFMWCYENEKDSIIIGNPKKIKTWGIPVDKIDLSTGEIIATYDSAAAAARDIGCHSDAISRVIRGERKSSHGYGWRRHETGSQ